MSKFEQKYRSLWDEILSQKFDKHWYRGDMYFFFYVQCEGIVEEYEENILQLFARDADNIDIKLCSTEAKLCSHSESDVDDYEFEDKDELWWCVEV